VKAVILAAGIGSRLRPLTNTVPKCLIEIKNGVSLLDYQIGILKSVGFPENQIFIVAGYKANKIKEKYNSLKYIINEKYTFNNIYSFYLIKNAILDDFVLINSDTLFPKILLQQLTKEQGFSTMVIDKKNTIGTEEMKVAVKKDGFIKRISKELPLRISLGEYIGLSLFKLKDAEMIFKTIENLLEEEKFNLWYEDAIDKMLVENRIRVKAYLIENIPWIEVDNIDDLRVARKKIKKIENYAL